MLDKSHRFHGLGSLHFVHRRGKMVSSENIGLRFAPNNRRSTYRVAVVVSKKVDKSAVRRNRIRRRIFAALSTQSSKITLPYDLVFYVYNTRVADMPAAKLQEQVNDLLKRADVLEDPKTGRDAATSHIIDNKES